MTVVLAMIEAILMAVAVQASPIVEFGACARQAARYTARITDISLQEAADAAVTVCAAEQLAVMNDAERLSPQEQADNLALARRIVTAIAMSEVIKIRACGEDAECRAFMDRD